MRTSQTEPTGTRIPAASSTSPATRTSVPASRAGSARQRKPEGRRGSAASPGAAPRRTAPPAASCAVLACQPPPRRLPSPSRGRGRRGPGPARLQRRVDGGDVGLDDAAAAQQRRIGNEPGAAVGERSPAPLPDQRMIVRVHAQRDLPRAREQGVDGLLGRWAMKPGCAESSLRTTCRATCSAAPATASASCWCSASSSRAGTTRSARRPAP